MSRRNWGLTLSPRVRVPKRCGLIAPHIKHRPLARNAALLSTLLLLRAEALELENRAAEAQAVRLDSLGWARYGFWL